MDYSNVGSVIGALVAPRGKKVLEVVNYDCNKFIVITRGYTAIMAEYPVAYLDAIDLFIKESAIGETHSVNHHSSIVRYARNLTKMPFYFAWEYTLADWKAMYEADADKAVRVAEGREKFTRSMGQYQRYDYSKAGFGKDYQFITSADNDLFMYIGSYRMIPVGDSEYQSGIWNKHPMCLQLEILIRRLTE